MDNHKYKIRVEIGVAAVVFLVGVFFVFQALTIETSREAVGPRTMPMILALATVVSGIVIAVRAFLDVAGDLKDGYGFQESDVKRIFAVIGCGVFFIFLFWGFGYFVALFFTFIAALVTFGVRSPLRMLIGAAIVAFVFQWLFMGIMRLNDPKGAIIDMRPYTNWIAGNY